MTTPTAQATQATLITPDTIRTASLYPLATLEERIQSAAILVTRHWPRGVARLHIDAWWRDAAPSAGLLKAYRRGTPPIPWETFETIYQREMRARLPQLREACEALVREFGPITLLCVEHCPRDGHDERDVRCHRRLLRELLLAPEGEETQP